MLKVLFSCLIALSSALVLAQPDLTDAQHQALQQRLESSLERLQLSDAQRREVTEIIRDSMMRQQEIFAAHGVNLQAPPEERKRLGWGDMRKLKKEMDPVREETNERLAAVLSEQQMETMRDIQKERRDEIRRRIREAKG